MQVWLLPHSWATSLFFPPPSSPLFAQGLKLAPEGTSPLLILTHDRKFAMGRRPGVPEPKAVTEESGEVISWSNDLTQLASVLHCRQEVLQIMLQCGATPALS